MKRKPKCKERRAIRREASRRAKIESERVATEKREELRRLAGKLDSVIAHRHK